MKQIAILITDGVFFDGAIDSAKLASDDGIEIFAIGMFVMS